MMNAAFAELGLDWRYVKLPVPPELFAETVRALPGSGYRGANVTIPHKLAAHELADELRRRRAGDRRGQHAGLRRRPHRGRQHRRRRPARRARAARRRPARLVLGAGGAGRAAVWALREAGAEVTVWNRTPERARGAGGGARACGTSSAPGAAELVVNATSVGLARGRRRSAGSGEAAAEALGIAAPPTPAVLVDLVYGDRADPLSRWAAARGAAVVDGLEVLVRQGARCFERWTGRRPPLEVMRETAAIVDGQGPGRLGLT